MGGTGMRALAFVISLTLAPLVVASAQTPDESAFAVASTEQVAPVTALPLPDSRMTVAVRIGEAGPYPFIIDTAAERTVIARELASELGLQPVGRSRLLSMTATRSTERVRMDGVSFVPGASQDLQAFIVDGENIGASGVLGIDALRDQRVVLDFRANTMSLSPAPRRWQGEPDAIIVQGRQRFGQLVLTQSRIDDVDVDVIIDSGLEVSVGNEALRRLLRARVDRRNAQQIALHSITGESVTANYAVVDEFLIARIRLSNLPVAFTNAHVFQRLRLTRRPALFLGMNALRKFDRVTIDFANRRAAFVMPQR